MAKRKKLKTLQELREFLKPHGFEDHAREVYSSGSFAYVDFGTSDKRREMERLLITNGFEPQLDYGDGGGAEIRVTQRSLRSISGFNTETTF
jgi:hypothetical protein